MARLGRSFPIQSTINRLIIIESASEYALTGVSGTGSVGSVIPGVGYQLSRNYATGLVGTVAVSLGASATGVSGTGMVGSVSYATALMLTPTQAKRLDAVFRLHGLIDPLVIVEGVSRGDGTVTQTLSGSTSPVTVHTTGLPATGAPTAALVDKLARWYGLIDDMVESDASRTDGTLSQTVVTVGTTTTITPT